MIGRANEGKRQTFIGVQPTRAPHHHPSSSAEQLVYRMGAWAQSAQAGRYVKQELKQVQGRCSKAV